LALNPIEGFVTTSTSTQKKHFGLPPAAGPEPKINSFGLLSHPFRISFALAAILAMISPDLHLRTKIF
jgi:hypothetical protein